MLQTNTRGSCGKLSCRPTLCSVNASHKINFLLAQRLFNYVGGQLNNKWGKRVQGGRVPDPHAISVMQLNLHVLYIPEFDGKKRRDLCTFITYFQVILFTKAVSLHELRFFSKMNKYLYLLSQALFFCVHCAFIT